MQRPSFSHALQQISHAYRRSMSRAIRDTNLPLPGTHVRALKGVCLLPECTAQKIAQRMRRDKAQITRVMNDLLAAGLISKHENPNDRRSQLLRPTAAGEALMQQIKALEAATVARMTRDLPPEEVEHFIRIACHMTQNLDEQPSSTD